MDAQLKAKWIEALRSGEYRQTRQTLRDDKGYCCLGVLCDVMGGRWRDDGEVVVNGAPQAGYLDDRLGGSIGLPEGVQAELYTMNDAGKPFPEIADYIEQNL